jgi:large subunit ribosomal protein L18
MRTIRKRRLESKTDYKLRFGLLKSGLPRVVVRKTNRHIIAQLVETDIAKDKILLGVTSKNLLQKGWPESLSGSLKSLPAAYLTGFLLGKLAKEKGISKAILDVGMQRNVHKSRIFATLSGLVDSGLKIPYDKSALPSEEDLSKNEKLKNIINDIKEKL